MSNQTNLTTLPSVGSLGPPIISNNSLNLNYQGRKISISEENSHGNSYSHLASIAENTNPNQNSSSEHHNQAGRHHHNHHHQGRHLSKGDSDLQIGDSCSVINGHVESEGGNSHQSHPSQQSGELKHQQPEQSQASINEHNNESNNQEEPTTNINSIEPTINMPPLGVMIPPLGDVNSNLMMGRCNSRDDI